MFGPVGSAEVTMADPLRGNEGRTYPSVLLTFGTLVLRVGWYNHGDSVQSTGVLYGEIEGDLVCQLIDISTGTPVVVQRAVKPMRPIYGDFPGDGFRLKGVKLDATRALLTWDNSYSQPAIIVSVSGGQVTFGDPVDIGGYITPTHDDGRPRDTAQGGTGILHDSVRQEDLVALDTGRAAFISTARVYHVAGDGTTWQITRMGCLLTTEGLVIQSFKWWYLSAGYPRFTYPEVGDSYNAALTTGGLTLIFTGTIQPNSDFASRVAYVYQVDFSVASTTVSPEITERALPRRPFDGMVTDGTYFVFADGAGYMLLPLANPMLGTLEEAATAQTEVQYHTPVGASFQHFLEPLATPRGWLGVTYGLPPVSFAELRRTGANAVATTGTPVTLNTTIPEPSSELYGYTAMMAGSRYCVALVDFELLVEPFNYREFLYVYEPIRQSEIESGVRRGAFLQVRAGVG